MQKTTVKQAGATSILKGIQAGISAGEFLRYLGKSLWRNTAAGIKTPVARSAGRAAAQIKRDPVNGTINAAKSIGSVLNNGIQATKRDLIRKGKIGLGGLIAANYTLPLVYNQDYRAKALNGLSNLYTKGKHYGQTAYERLFTRPQEQPTLPQPSIYANYLGDTTSQVPHH